MRCFCLINEPKFDRVMNFRPHKEWIYSLSKWPIVHPSAFIHLFIQSFIYPFIYLFIHPFIRSSVCSFVPSFFIHSVIHLFIHLSILSFIFLYPLFFGFIPCIRFSSNIYECICSTGTSLVSDCRRCFQCGF